MKRNVAAIILFLAGFFGLISLAAKAEENCWVCVLQEGECMRSGPHAGYIICTEYANGNCEVQLPMCC